jgi:LPS sulfotransferase NodH
MTNDMMPKESRPIPFVIFATQRTGSNWLMGMLDAHPAIAAYDELLLEGVSGNGYWGRTDLEFFASYYSRHRKSDNQITRARWSFRYLKELYSRRPGTDAIGMKLMYDQLWKNPWVWAYMIRYQVRIIHLVRVNLLDIILSLETVKARKRPHAWEGEVVDMPTITLDLNTTVSSLKVLDFRVKTARWLLRLLPVRHIEMSYEQLIADPSLVDHVFAFLKVPTRLDSSDAQSRFKKLNTAKKADLVENYEDLERALRGTRFEHFLDG